MTDRRAWCRTVASSLVLLAGSPAGAAAALALAVDELAMQDGRQDRNYAVKDFEDPARAVIQQRYDQVPADLKTGRAQ